MVDRLQVERLLQQLYAARVGGRLDERFGREFGGRLGERFGRGLGGGLCYTIGAACELAHWPVLIPSVVDDSLAPGGAHVASLFCQQFAPVLPDGRSWDDARELAADLIVDTVNDHAPNFKASILGRMVLSPLDLERTFGLTGGDIMHGHLSLDQLWAARPVLGHASYRAPIHGTGEVGVQFWIEEFGRTHAVYGFRFVSGDTVHAEGRRVNVKLDPGTLRPSPWTPAARAVASKLLVSAGG